MMFLQGRRNTQAGFTLIELMIVLVIMAVIMAVSAPSMFDLVQKNRLQTSADNFFVGLMLARSEAVKRNQPVVICKSSSGSACVTSSYWEQGWMIFADQDSDGVKDAGEPVLQVGEALRGGDTLRSGAPFANQLTYRTDGSSSGTSTFVFCDAELNLSSAREILVTITGRPKRQLKTAGTCPV